MKLNLKDSFFKILEFIYPLMAPVRELLVSRPLSKLAANDRQEFFFHHHEDMHKKTMRSWTLQIIYSTHYIHYMTWVSSDCSKKSFLM